MREDPSSGFSSGSELSDELRLLCMLHNIGATESGRSLTLHQISEWTKMDTPALESHLQKLIGLGYVQFWKGLTGFLKKPALRLMSSI